MIAINLSGITFLEDDTKRLMIDGKIGFDDPVTIVQTGDLTQRAQGDYSVRCKDNHIGWIPQLGTIMRYMNKAHIAKEQFAYDKQDKRYDTVDILRGNITCDLHINKVVPEGHIAQILFKTKNGFDEVGNGDMSRKVACVSVVFDYPYP